MGLIYVTVGAVANIMFKNMGMANDKAAFWSSHPRLPLHVQVPLGARAGALQDEEVLRRADAVRDRRRAGRLSRSGCGCPGPSWIAPALTLVAITAVLGATQDIGTDGVYVTTLPPEDQAKYLGFQSMCWNGGALLAKGPFVIVSGTLHDSTGSWPTAWMIVMLALGAFVFLAGLYHSRMLPPGAQGGRVQELRRRDEDVRPRVRVVLPEEGRPAHDRLRVPLPVRLRPARQDGAAVPDRLPRQPRARALEPGRRRRLRHVRQRRVHRRARCWAASSCRARASRRRCCCSAFASTSPTRRSCS